MAFFRTAGRCLRHTVAFLLLLLLSAVALCLFFPERACQHALRLVLDANGYTNVQFRVEHVDLSEFVLGEIRMGAEAPRLEIDAARLRYSLRGLRERRIDAVEADGVRAHLLKGPERWVVAGAPELPTGGKTRWDVGRVTLRDARINGPEAWSDFVGPLRIGLLHAVAESPEAWRAWAAVQGSVVDPRGKEGRRHVLDLRGGGEAGLPEAGGWLYAFAVRETNSGCTARFEGSSGGNADLSSRHAWSFDLAPAFESPPPVSHAVARFTREADGVLRFEALRMEAFGGTIEAQPFAFDPAEPAVDLTVAVRGINTSAVAAILPDAKWHAEGPLDGEIRAAWAPGGPPRVRAELSSPADTTGQLRMEDPSLLTRHMGEDDERVRSVARSLRDLRYRRLRVVLDLTDAETATATLNIEGRSALDRDLPPVKLNVNFEADTEDVYYLGRLLRKLSAPRLDAETAVSEER